VRRRPLYGYDDLKALVAEGAPMRVTYDRETDTLTITLRDQRIRESEEVKPGVIADFGYDGGMVRFEVLRASQVVKKTTEIQFVVAA
jgi:uncharacterized protein YuzE